MARNAPPDISRHKLSSIPPQRFECRQNFQCLDAAAFVIAGAGLPVQNTEPRGNESIRKCRCAVETWREGGRAAQISKECLNEIGICLCLRRSITQPPPVLPVCDASWSSHHLQPARTSNESRGAPRQIIGVWHPALVEPCTHLGSAWDRARMGGPGSDGLDEVT